VIDRPEKFSTYHDSLPVIQEWDYFYRSKFRNDMIRAPYLWHWLTKPRNRRLVALLRERNRRRAQGTYGDTFEAAPFHSVMKRNLRLAAEMYGKEECRALFKALVLLFATEARAAGSEPVFVMFPQLLDLEGFGNRQPYRSLLDELGQYLIVVDAADALNRSDVGELYTEDTYGGHYSAEGNAVIAQLMERYVAPLLERENSRQV